MYMRYIKQKLLYKRLDSPEKKHTSSDIFPYHLPVSVHFKNESMDDKQYHNFMARTSYIPISEIMCTFYRVLE